MATDPYEVLGVDRDADLSQIRRAYLTLLRANHPDLRPGDEAAEQRTRELNRAWEQVESRRRRGDGAAITAPAQPGRRVRAAPYSRDRRAYRTAFTTATLRLALLLMVFGLLLLLVTVGR